MTKATSVSALLASEAFTATDRHFASLMERLAGSDSPALTLASALASRWLAEGQGCLPLDQVAGRPYPQAGSGSGAQVDCPYLAEWEEQLRATPVVGRPGEVKPLILDESGRLYLQRYWRYEQDVAGELLKRLAGPPSGMDEALLADTLKRLFPGSSQSGETDWQKVAVFAAVRQRLCVITGGPGTGKTYTVARLLAAMLEQPGGDKRIIRLAAPTGKAVARLQESLREAAKDLAVAEVIKAKLQDEAITTTIHRLLGTIPDSVSFRHDATNPLSADVLVVDEASMVSLSLMARLLAALKPEARLVLVGDKDQLPPVDPGGVLHDLCRAAASNSFSQGFCADYHGCCGETICAATQANAGGLADAVVRLPTNHRSGNSRFLHDASVFVNAGDADGFLKLARQPETTGSTVVWQELPQPVKLKDALKNAVREHYQRAIQCASVAEALKVFGQFRILCAVREGPYGCEAVNRLVEDILREDGSIPAESLRQGSYRGKPVMVTANNYLLKLFNGDIGLVWPEEGRSLVYFPAKADGTRAVARERLPAHETVYAMTVHKSQGSEFQHVMVILPDRETPLLTRQLLYTGLTRAREYVTILAPETILRQAIAAQAQRASGLGQALQSQARSP